MSELILPDSRAEMPELFIPNMQPHSRVKIDRNHDINRNCEICVIGSQPRELMHEFDLQYRNSATKEINIKGVSIETYAATAAVEVVGSSYINVQDAEPFTIALLVYISSTISSGTIFGNRDDSNANFQVYTEGGRIRLRIGSTFDAFPIDVANDTWYVIHITWNGDDTAELYINGVYASNLIIFSSTDPIDTLTPLSLGARWNGYPTTGYEGDYLIPFLRFWKNRELPAGEISDHSYDLYKGLIPA